MRRQFAGSAFLQAAILATFVAVVLGIAATLMSARGFSDSVNLKVAIAVAAPFVLLRDFARRMSFAHLVVSGAIAVDGAVLILQLSVLLALWHLGWLSAATAYLAIAGACAIPGFVWLWSLRDNFVPMGSRLVADARRSLSLGRWILASQIVSILSSYLIYWLVAVILGTDASGVLFACSAIILLSNPVIIGTNTYMLPRLAAALADEGHAGVQRVALRTTILLAAVMSMFSLAAYMFGDIVLQTIYGASYAGYAAVSGLYGLAVLSQAVGTAPDQALWVKQRSEISFWIGLVGLGCMVVCALWLVPSWGLIGAVSAVVVGNTITSAMRWAAMMQLIAKSPEREMP